LSSAPAGLSRTPLPEFHALLDGYRRFRTGAYREQKERFDTLI
jgi:hypothetical protein